MHRKEAARQRLQLRRAKASTCGDVEILHEGGEYPQAALLGLVAELSGAMAAIWAIALAMGVL